MSFIQIIEVTSTRPGDIVSLMDEWVEATEGKRKAHRSVLGGDRDRPNTYVQIVEFASYEDAMANSALAETSRFAQKLSELCDGPPTFRNLEVRRIDDLS